MGCSDLVFSYLKEIQKDLLASGRGIVGGYKLSKLYKKIALDRNLNVSELKELRLRLDIIKDGWLELEDKKSDSGNMSQVKKRRDKEKIKAYLSKLEDALKESNFLYCFGAIYKEMVYDSTLTILELEELRLRLAIMKEEYNTYLQKSTIT